MHGGDDLHNSRVGHTAACIITQARPTSGQSTDPSSGHHQAHLTSSTAQPSRSSMRLASSTLTEGHDARHLRPAVRPRGTGLVDWTDRRGPDGWGAPHHASSCAR